MSVSPFFMVITSALNPLTRVALELNECGSMQEYREKKNKAKYSHSLVSVHYRTTETKILPLGPIVGLGDLVQKGLQHSCGKSSCY
jgi:hypothetical protein